MLKKVLYPFIFLLVFIASCKEPYNPDIDTNVSGIVINGLITDEPGPYTVNLTRPISFYGIQSVPVQNANVYVTDENNNTFYFYETLPGVYKSDPQNFKTAYYSKYTLNVFTKDGHRYLSTPQVLYPKGTIDSVHSVVRNKTMTTYQNGLGERIKDINGVDFICNFYGSSDSPYFRYSNMLIVEFDKKYSYIHLDTPFYSQHCWIKYIPYQHLNLSDIKSNQQLLGFCPLDSNFYGTLSRPLYSCDPPAPKCLIGFLQTKILLFAITFKQYHVNKDVYNYFKDVNSQLDASQKFLDPINIQCDGNLVSISNPDEHVMGVFEVSSVSLKSYLYHKDMNGYVDLHPLHSFDANLIENDDCIYQAYPDFWMNK